MSWNNIIPWDLIEVTGGVHSTTSVDEVPEIELSRWAVIEVTSSKAGMPGDHHFVGWNLTEGEGRVSSRIIMWNKESRIGTTESGRTYRLVGDPGIDMDAMYVFGTWKVINEVTEYTNVSEQYEEGAPTPPTELL